MTAQKRTEKQARRDARDAAEFRAAARKFTELGYDRADAVSIEDFVANRYANNIARAAARSRDFDAVNEWAYYIDGVTRALA